MNHILFVMIIAFSGCRLQAEKFIAVIRFRGDEGDGIHGHMKENYSRN